MNDIVIRVENLSKKFQIGKRRGRYKSLRDTLTDAFVAPFHKVGKLLRGHPTGAAGLDETIWALKDVTFEIKRGEIFGIVGRNGAGKSTLLKILSRITEPTMGSAEIRGRVGSLLEVGTGFHPELTGRENIYLYGAIIGMKRDEIEKKFDHIVTFAEVEKFIDTPVKHYSSGMHLRLAFSVAAHLEPDIMLVDEVLAVGDIGFWTKSINRMRSLNEQGMTIVLVSHDMWLIQTLCSRAICLEKGSITAGGKPLNVIGAYKNMIGVAADKGIGQDEAVAKEAAEILTFQIMPEGNWFTEKEAFPDSGARVILTAKVTKYPKIKFFLRLTAPDGFPYFTVYSDIVDAPRGLIECEAVIPHLMLMPGEYLLWGAVCSDRGEDQPVATTYLRLSVKDNGMPRHEKSFFWNKADWSIRARG